MTEFEKALLIMLEALRLELRAHANAVVFSETGRGGFDEVISYRRAGDEEAAIVTDLRTRKQT